MPGYAREVCLPGACIGCRGCCRPQSRVPTAMRGKPCMRLGYVIEDGRMLSAAKKAVCLGDLQVRLGREIALTTECDAVPRDQGVGASGAPYVQRKQALGPNPGAEACPPAGCCPAGLLSRLGCAQLSRFCTLFLFHRISGIEKMTKHVAAVGAATQGAR